MRSSGGGGGSQVCRRSGSADRSNSSARSTRDLVVGGEQIDNRVGAQAEFRYSPALTLGGGYCWEYLAFLDAGGKETAHSTSAEVAYQWGQQHSLRARYTFSILRSRDGQESLIHDIDFGDTFLSQQTIQLTPTLTLSLAAGVALETGGSGSGGGKGNSVSIENTFDVELTKIWRSASITSGVRRGFTNSLGFSGPSLTTSFFSHLETTLTRRLNGAIGVDYSLYDAEGGEYDTLQAFAALQYQATSWLSVSLVHSYRRLNPSSGGSQGSLFARDVISGHNVFLGFSLALDLWPSPGLARDNLGFPAQPSLQAPGVRSPSRTVR